MPCAHELFMHPARLRYKSVEGLDVPDSRLSNILRRYNGAPVKNCLSSARTTRKDPKDRPKPINATADTVRSKPIFREAYRKRRCPLTASVAIDGSKFKAVNTRDKNFTRGKVGRRRAQLEESAARCLAQLGTADRQEPSEELAAKTAHLRDKLVKLESEMQRLAAMEKLMLAPPEGA